MRTPWIAALAVVGACTLAACGGGGSKPVPTTTTTEPPPTTTTAPPAVLTIAPPTARIGTIVTLTVAGAKPGESVTFTITSPQGKVFTGSPHEVDAVGGTSATYNSTGDVAGDYSVKATGTGGTDITGTLTLTK